MKYYSLVIIVMLFFTSCDFKSAETYYQEASILEDQKLYSDAIPLLDKAIQKNPKFIDAYINRGVNKSIIGKFNEAISDFNKVIQLDPDNVLALYNKAGTLVDLEEYGKAIEFYNKCLNLKGGEFVNFDWNKNSYYLTDQAMYDVDSKLIHFERGVAYYMADSIQRAYRAFEGSIANNYNVKQSYYYLGGVWYASGNLEKACQCYKKAMKMKDYDSQQLFLKYCKK